MPEHASPFITFLRSISNLHLLCTGRDIDNHRIIINDFTTNFDYLYENFNMNMTLKIHIILHHYSDYFDWTGKSFHYTNGEFVESSHYTIKREEETHGFKVKRSIGTPSHKEKSLKSFIWHNTKRAGFTPPPSKFNLKKCSPLSI